MMMRDDITLRLSDDAELHLYAANPFLVMSELMAHRHKASRLVL